LAFISRVRFLLAGAVYCPAQRSARAVPRSTRCPARHQARSSPTVSWTPAAEPAGCWTGRTS